MSAGAMTWGEKQAWLPFVGSYKAFASTALDGVVLYKFLQPISNDIWVRHIFIRYENRVSRICAGCILVVDAHGNPNHTHPLDFAPFCILYGCGVSYLSQ